MQLTIKEIIIVSLAGGFLLFILPSVKPYLSRLEDKFKKKKKSSKKNNRKVNSIESKALVNNIQRMRFADIAILMAFISSIILFLLYFSGTFDRQPLTIIITAFSFFFICGLLLMVFGMRNFVIPLTARLEYYYHVYFDKDYFLLICLFIVPVLPMILFPGSGWAEVLTVLIFIFLTGLLLKEKSVWLGTGYVAVMLFVMMLIMNLD